MLDRARHHEQLGGAEDDVAITQRDGQLPLDHQEQFVGVLVGMPDELSPDLDELDLVVVAPGAPPLFPVRWTAFPVAPSVVLAPSSWLLGGRPRASPSRRWSGFLRDG